MRGYGRGVDPRHGGARIAGDFSFMMFSLAHAACGEEGVIELRRGERLLLVWYASCAVLEIFSSSKG
jgi:hypothetical protein